MNSFKQYVMAILSIVGRVIPKLAASSLADIANVGVKKDEEGNYTASARGKTAALPIKEQEATALNNFRTLIKMEKESGETLSASLGIRHASLTWAGDSHKAAKTVTPAKQARKRNSNVTVGTKMVTVNARAKADKSNVVAAQ